MQQILEVAIGLALVTAVVSLVVSASMELIATVLRLRSRALEQGIGRMLDEAFATKDGVNPITGGVFSHPMILAQSSPRAAAKGKKPSYIDAVTFTTAFLDTSVLNATLVGKFVEAKDKIDATVKTVAADNSPGAAALRRAWGLSGGSPTTLVGLLLNDPNGPAALVYLMGGPDVVAARIADLEHAGDPAAPKLRSEWAASGNDVTAFVERLETPELVTRFVQGADAVSSAIQEIKASHPFLGRTLEQLWIRAGSDFKKFRHEIEDWYDREMQRVSGWYTRWTKWIMIAVGVAIAVAMNISLTTIGLSLWNDSTLRSSVVAEASAIVQRSQQATTTVPPGAPASTTKPSAGSKCVLPAGTSNTGIADSGKAGGTAIAGVQCLQGIDLPIGWNSTAWPGFHWGLLLHLLGVLMVGVATSFGAPFWFGLLGRLVNLRGGGPQPPTAAEQRPAVGTQTPPA